MNPIPFAGRLTEADVRTMQLRVLRPAMLVIVAVFLLMFTMSHLERAFRQLFVDPVGYAITWMPMLLLVPLWIVVLRWASGRS